jgi:hypothetical protein
MFFSVLSLRSVVYALAQILGAPFQNPSILWFGLPLLVALIIFELNLKEDKRWRPKGSEDNLKQALPNAIVLLFISIDLFRITFSGGDILSRLLSGDFIASAIVLLLCAAIFLIDYFHEFPKKKILGFSAHLPANALAYSMMVVVYDAIPFDASMICGTALFTILLAVLFYLVSRLEMEKKAGRGNDEPQSRSRKEFGNSKLIWIRKEDSGKSTRTGTKAGKSTLGGDVADPFRGAKKR